MNRLIAIVLALAGLMLAFALGFWVRGGHEQADDAAATPAAEAQREVLYWYDPMYPDKRFDQPGKSPFMDMDLVPKYAAPAPAAQPEVLYWYDPMYPDKRFDRPGKSPFMDMDLVPKYAAQGGDGGDGDVVRIAPETVQNLGVRTAPVQRGTLATGAVVPGTLTWDERASYEVSARASGVLERLHVRAAFEPVRAGQALAELRAPEWSAAIAEYRALGEASSADARALRSAARERLLALGMDAAQIGAIGSGDASARVVLRAPTDGVVSSIDVRQGQQVGAGTSLMTVNGLDTIWVEAAIPQAQAAGVGIGTPVQASVSAFPGQSFPGQVEALLPTVDPRTRTQTARVVLDNPGHRLVPGMFAEIRFEGADAPPRPLVPDEALIATGIEARVIVAQGDGRFRPVRVTTGRSAGGMTEILDGLSGDEQVVVSGQFLIDSEASLSGALQRLGNEASDAAPAAAQPVQEPPKPDPHAEHHQHGTEQPQPEPAQ